MLPMLPLVVLCMLPVLSSCPGDMGVLGVPRPVGAAGMLSMLPASELPPAAGAAGPALLLWLLLPLYCQLRLP